jgi:hypothetical protein
MLLLFAIWASNRINKASSSKITGLLLRHFSETSKPLNLIQLHTMTMPFLIQMTMFCISLCPCSGFPASAAGTTAEEAGHRNGSQGFGLY